MTYAEALVKRKTVTHLKIHRGDLIYVEIPILHPTTSEPTQFDSGFIATADYEGPAVFTPGICGDATILARSSGTERVYIPPFPKSDAARDWSLRESMGSLYDPDKPRNDGLMPETEWE